ncbi:MAG: right-handed parallel beta-helix repeat-containing protein [Armatimonadota bacterium]|nr:right-handed parallel beta-helix repeat-containing protein [bacterium]
MSRIRSWISMLFVCSLFTGLPLQAAVIYVKPTGDDNSSGLSWASAKKTLSSAMQLAGSGDEIWVCTGIYEERITLNSSVRLYGGFSGTETHRSERNSASNPTVIDGKSSGSVVTIAKMAASDTIIDGFTIQHGSAYYGAGIYCEAAGPTISGNVITGCTATGHAEWQFLYVDPNGMPYYMGIGYGGNGGAIYCKDASPTITDNNIVRNAATGWNTGWPPYGYGQPTEGEGYGGGVCCVGTCSPNITRNAISDNSSRYYGGGIYCEAPVSATITANIISGNTTSAGDFLGYGGSGGGVYCCTDSRTFIANNRIERNVASESGGGILCDGALITVSSNVIRGNSAGFYGGGIECIMGSVLNNTIVGNATYHCYGGGVSCYSYIAAVIVGNVVAFNSSGIWANHGGGQPDGLVTLRNNCIYNPDGLNYNGLADATGKNGNVSVDPRLVAPEYGNVTLMPDSPCVNAGDNGVVESSWTDMAGNPRIQLDRVDIGAYESDKSQSSYQPQVIRVSPSGDDALDGSSWQMAKRTMQAAVDAVAIGGGDVWVAEGSYNTSLNLKMNAHVFGGFAGRETLRSERNALVHPTIIAGTPTSSVVVANNIGFGLATVDGFIIQNGSCGVSCNYSGPRISNNVITNNGLTTYSAAGGVYCSWASPIIVDNTISQNKGTAGGVACSYSSAIITENLISKNTGTGIRCQDFSLPTITKNVITSNRGTSGGGIYCYYAGDFMPIQFNTISGNSATNAGGGIYSVCTAWPMIEHNIIKDNSAGDTYYKGDGGGVFGSGVLLVSNLISGNQASRNGGGVYTRGNPLLGAQNTIVGNTAVNGGGIYGESINTSFDILDNIIASNSSGIYTTADVTLKLRSNCFYNPSGTNYDGKAAKGSGDIVADPRFFDAAHGDYHLKSDSPCIDKGIQETWLLNTDLDGHQCPVDGNSDGVPTIDVGCFEAFGQYERLADIKSLPDGSVVRFSNGVVTASLPGRFYVETADRIMGIGISGTAPGVGKKVTIEGNLTTTDGERLITSTWIGDSGNEEVPLPWFMTERSLGGGQLGFQDGVSDWHAVRKSNDDGKPYYQRELVSSGGVNNIGLLVKMIGRVSQSTTTYFYLDGGAGIDDGIPAIKGVRVDWPFSNLPPADGSIISILGVSSCRVVHDSIAGDVVVRLLRPVSANSIVIIR